MEYIEIISSNYDCWRMNLQTGAIIHTMNTGTQPMSVAWLPSDFDKIMESVIRARNHWDTVREGEVKQQLWKLEMEGK